MKIPLTALPPSRSFSSGLVVALLAASGPLALAQTAITSPDGATAVETDRPGAQNQLRFRVGNVDRLVMRDRRFEFLNNGQSIFIGVDAGRDDDLTNNRNSFIGSLAGQRNVNGQLNTGIGFSALRSNVDNSNNTAIGPSALQSLAAGATNNANTAIGPRALLGLTGGASNLAIGTDAGRSLVSGVGNVFVGQAAGVEQAGGNFNTFIGSGAGGGAASGSRNVMIGFRAGLNETGSDKLYIANSDAAAPLIKGDFAAGALNINGTTTIDGDLTVTGQITSAGGQGAHYPTDQHVVVMNRLMSVDSGVVHAVYDPQVAMPNQASALFGDARTGGFHGTGATLLADYRGLNVAVANDYCGALRPAARSAASSTCPDTIFGARLDARYTGTGVALGQQIYSASQSDALGIDVLAESLNAVRGQRLEIIQNPGGFYGAANGLEVLATGQRITRGIEVSGSSQTEFYGVSVSGSSTGNATGVEATMSGGFGLTYGASFNASSAGTAIGVRGSASGGGTSVASGIGGVFEAGGSTATGVQVYANAGSSHFGGVGQAAIAEMTAVGQYATGISIDVESTSASGTNHGVDARVVGRDSTFGAAFGAFAHATHSTGVRGTARAAQGVPTAAGVEGVADNYKMATGVDACAFSADSLSIGVDARAKRGWIPLRPAPAGLQNTPEPLGLSEESSIGVRAAAVGAFGHDAFAFYADSTSATGSGVESWGVYSPYNQNYAKSLRLGTPEIAAISPAPTGADSLPLYVNGGAFFEGYAPYEPSEPSGIGVIRVEGHGLTAIKAQSFSPYSPATFGTGGEFSGGSLGVSGSGITGGSFSGGPTDFYYQGDTYGVAASASSPATAYAFKADTSTGTAAYAFHADYNSSFLRRLSIGRDTSTRYYNLPLDSTDLSAVGQSVFFSYESGSGPQESTVHIQNEAGANANRTGLSVVTDLVDQQMRAGGTAIQARGQIGIAAQSFDSGSPADTSYRAAGDFTATGSGSGAWVVGSSADATTQGPRKAFAVFGHAHGGAGTGRATGGFFIGVDIGVSAIADVPAGKDSVAYGLRTRATNNSNRRAYGLYVRETTAPEDSLEYAIHAGYNKSYLRQLALGSDNFAAGYPLSVDGNIMTSGTLVMADVVNWPDYVFRDDYALAPLSEVKSYIGEHGHLPGLPSEAEVARDGQDVGEIQRALLEKIEEITLHLIAEQEARRQAETHLSATENVLADVLTRLDALERANGHDRSKSEAPR